jgi:hypothetical protein
VGLKMHIPRVAPALHKNGGSRCVEKRSSGVLSLDMVTQSSAEYSCRTGVEDAQLLARARTFLA